MGIDVVDVAGAEARVGNGVLHAGDAARAVFPRAGDVVGVRTHAEAEKLRINGCAPLLSPFVFLQYQNACAVAEHKAVPVLVPRAAGGLRRVVAGGQRLHVGKSGYGSGRGAELGAAHDHDIGFAVLNHPRRHANVVGARGAGRDHGDVGAPVAVHDGQMATDHVDDAARHEKGRHPARPALFQGRSSLLDVVDAADAGADRESVAVRVLRVAWQARIGNGLNAGGNAVLDELVATPGLLALHVELGVKIPHLSGKGDGEARGIKGVDRRNAAFAGDGVAPGVGYGIA